MHVHKSFHGVVVEKPGVTFPLALYKVGSAAGLWRFLGICTGPAPAPVAELEPEPAAEPASDPDLCQSQRQTGVRVGDLVHDALISAHCAGRIEIAGGVICSVNL